MGVPYEVVRSVADEVMSGDTAVTLAATNAVAKVRGAALPAGVPLGAFVLGTDTLVTLGDRVMGKPGSRDDARDMITALSGRTHQVVSGVALMRLGSPGAPEGAPGATVPSGGAGQMGGAATGLIVATAVTDVTFGELSAAQVEAYLASGEWTDKAGAYGIQGLAGMFATEVRGEYSNVVGLPLCLLARLFREAGFDLMRRQWI